MNNEELVPLEEQDLSLFGRRLQEWIDKAGIGLQRVSQATAIPRARLYRLMKKQESSSMTYPEIISLSQILNHPSNEILAVYHSSQQGLEEVPPDLLEASDAEMYIITYLSLPKEKRSDLVVIMQAFLERAKHEDPEEIQRLLLSLPTMQPLNHESKISGKPHTRKTRRGHKPSPAQKEEEQSKEPPLT